MISEYNIRLNPNCAVAINTGLRFKSGDKGITFVIAVDELDTTGTTAKIVFQRANGTSVESDITGSDGVYSYKTLGNEFAVPGKTVADVKFYASEDRVSTASFVFEVVGDTMAGLGAGTGGYSDRLEQLVAEAEEAGELTEQAKTELESTEAEMAAVLKTFKEQYGEVGALNPRGNWNSSVSYATRDMVYYMNCSWICVAGNKNIVPSVDSVYWMKNVGLEAGESGARNMFKYPYVETTKTSNNVSFVDNGDGSVTLSGITNSNYGYFRLSHTERSLKLNPGTYTVGLYLDDIGLLQTGSKYVAIQLNCYSVADDTNVVSITVYTTRTFTIDKECYVAAYISYSDPTGVEHTVYPMLELGSVAHEWRPYHSGGAEDAKTVNGFAIYTDVSKLGIESYHIPDIIKAMPGNSMFYARVISGGSFALSEANNALPSVNGSLEILKAVGSGRTRVLYSTGTNVSKSKLYLCDIDENNWIINGWNYVGDGGNADTLDNLHATDFMRAMTPSRVREIGFDSSLDLYVSIDGTKYPIPFGMGRYDVAKKTDLAKYLPLDGSVPMSGNLYFAGGVALLEQVGNHVNLAQYNKDDSGAINIQNARFLSIYNSTEAPNLNNALQLTDKVNGVATRYPVLHTGNSIPVATGTTAPTDTTALWVDTASKVIKKYIDGAWTQVS